MTTKRKNHTLSLRKQSLCRLADADLVHVAGGIDVDGSGRAIIIYSMTNQMLTNYQVDTGTSR